MNTNAKATQLKGLRIGWKLAGLRKNPANSILCVVCGKAFLKRGKRSRSCCSLECKAKKQIGKRIFGFNVKPKHGPIITCKTCGKIFQRAPSQSGKYCSRDCVTADPEFWLRITGSNHYLWKGGITPEMVKLRTGEKAKDWRMGVFRRDKFRCRICSMGRDLEAHHRRHWSDFPELRFDVSNGITLCRTCHKMIHWYGRHFTGRINHQLSTDYEL